MTDYAAEITRLRAQAKQAADKRVRALTREDHRRFAPSRLEKCPRDQALLAAWEAEAEADELAKRAAQIAWCERKLARRVA